MTAYPSDFYSPPEAAGFAPEDPVAYGPGPDMGVGLDVGAGAWLILLVVLLAGTGFLLGRFMTLRERREDVRRNVADIHAAVLKAAEAALGARSHDLAGKASALKTVIEDRLGPVIAIGSGLGKPVKALSQALEGKAPKDDGHGKDHGHGPGHGSGHGAGHGPAHGGGVIVQVIGVGGGHDHAGHGHGGHGEHGHGSHDAHEERKMTAEEQTDALAKAVRNFHDYWSQSGKRIAELGAAHAALERKKGVIAAATPAGKDGEGRGKYIWER